MDELDALAAELGERLKAREETVAVAESSSGGPDLGGAAERARRVGLLSGRGGGLHAARRGWC